MRFPVTLTKDTNGTFLATVPDVPEAVSYGDTKDDALAHVRDAVLTVFDARMRDKRDIPEPSAATRARHFIDLPTLDVAKIELYRAMLERRVNKSELARRLSWHLPQVDRVLNIRHASQLEQIEAAFGAMGKRICFAIVDDAPMPHVHGVLLKASKRAKPVATSRLAAKKR